MPEVVFTDAAIDDLRRLGPDIAPRVLKKITILFDDPRAGQPLGGELTGFRKLVVGRNHWRVVYRVDSANVVEVCEVWCAGARSDAEVYAEASTRVAAAEQTPAVRRLADVIAALGRWAGGVRVEDEVPAAPVPDWLARRLVESVGLPVEQVAALDLDRAVALWEECLTTPRA